MGMYERRDRPAYSPLKADDKWGNNSHILSWWELKHDQALEIMVLKWQWVWYWQAADAIVNVTPAETLDKWRGIDPICNKYDWRNVLMYFAAARAAKTNITKNIRPAKLKKCPLCENPFVEDSLPMPLIERLGIDHLDFCSPCLSSAVLRSSGKDESTREEIITYLQSLTYLIERIPPQNFGEGTTDLESVPLEKRLNLLKLLKTRPTLKGIKKVFGSWLKALIDAQILEDGTRKTSRGIQCIAEDGHVCLSLGEKTIDDFLFRSGIPHIKEPHYPEGNYRGDFQVGSTFIEYFGLAGNPEYDEKIKHKTQLCSKHHINLVAIYPEDLLSQSKLAHKLLLLAKEFGK